MERMVATSWRQELMRPSWKEKFVCDCHISRVRICQSFVRWRILTSIPARSKKKVAWLAIRFPAKFCDA